MRTVLIVSGVLVGLFAIFLALPPSVLGTTASSVQASSRSVFSGIVKFANGTAAAPSITFTSDTDTGVFRVGANDYGLTTGGTQRVDVSTTDVTSTLGLTISGVGSSVFGDKLVVDNNGIMGGWPATDAAPQPISITGQSASPLGSTNVTGGNLNLLGGIETITATAVQANCGAGDTLTLTHLGPDGVAVSKTCTRHASTDDATNFTCGASDAALATNIAACLATATGVGACAGTTCTVATVGFLGVSGNYYVYPLSTEPAAIAIKLVSSGDHSVVTLGTEGKVLVPSVLNFATGASGTIAAPDVGLSRLSANVLAVGTGAAGSPAGTVQLTNLNFGAVADQSVITAKPNDATLGDYVQVDNYYVTLSGFGVGASGATLETLMAASGFRVTSDTGYFFMASATNTAAGSPDGNISHIGAGILGVGTGTDGSTAGTLRAAHYQTLVATIAADDATPSVSGSDLFKTSANVAPTAITDLDDPAVDQILTICGGSSTNASTIADSGNFNLSAAITLSVDDCITLWVQADNDYIELSRADNTP